MAGKWAFAYWNDWTDRTADTTTDSWVQPMTRRSSDKKRDPRGQCRRHRNVMRFYDFISDNQQSTAQQPNSLVEFNGPSWTWIQSASLRLGWQTNLRDIFVSALGWEGKLIRRPTARPDQTQSRVRVTSSRAPDDDVHMRLPNNEVVHGICPVRLDD